MLINEESYKNIEMCTKTLIYYSLMIMLLKDCAVAAS